jgi:hypothetical protein
MCVCNKLASYTFVARTSSYIAFVLGIRLLHGTYGYAQVISYSEGVRLSSRLGSAISDVWSWRVCMYYMFM